MVTVKKDTISTSVFEKKIIGLIKLVKIMEMPEHTKTILLDELRNIHLDCLEYEQLHKPILKDETFKIIDELRVD